MKKGNSTMGKQVNVKLIFLIIGLILALSATILIIKIKKDEEAVAYQEWADKVIPEDEYEGIPDITEKQLFKDIEGVKDKRVLVCFYANWCGPWKNLEPIVEDVARENPEIEVVKINTDKNEDATLKYDAYSLPALVYFKRGVEVKRHTGTPTKEQIEALIK